MVMLTDDSCEVVTGSEDFLPELDLNNARVGYEKQSFNLTPIVFSDEDMMHDVRSTVDESTFF